MTQNICKLLNFMNEKESINSLVLEGFSFRIKILVNIMLLQIKLLILVPFSITGVSHKAVSKFKTSVGNHEESEDEQCSFEQRSSRSDSFRKQRVVRGTLSKSFETFLNPKIRQVQALDEILFYIMSCEFPLLPSCSEHGQQYRFFQ